MDRHISDGKVVTAAISGDTLGVRLESSGRLGKKLRTVVQSLTETLFPTGNTVDSGSRASDGILAGPAFRTRSNRRTKSPGRGPGRALLTSSDAAQSTRPRKAPVLQTEV